MKRLLRILLSVALIGCAVLPVAGLAAVNPVYGYSVDLPVGWTQADNSDPAHIGFLSPNADAMIQIMTFGPGAAVDGMELAALMLEEVRGTGAPEPFEYQSRSAALSEIEFETGGLAVRGYLLAVNDRQADYALLAFATLDAYDAAHDHLLSALDSFAPDDESRAFPGPISQFFYPFPPPDPRSHALGFRSARLPFAADPGEEEASRVLVDREARILSPYGALDRGSFSAAWRRYFRVIYRDNSMRLVELSTRIDALLREEGVPRVDYPHEILAWLQGFDYERTGGLSDFQPPVSCVVNTSGDCDSLGMTYVIILHHLGFDAILMASDRYAHALAAVDVQGPGARFPFEGTQWLVAELTDRVPLGRIPASMADPEGWIGVRLRLRPAGAGPPP